jgi:hypothetical protein
MGPLSFSFRRWAVKWPPGWKPGIRAKLLFIFLLAKIIPLIFLAFVAWNQFFRQGEVMRDIAVTDAVAALNDRAVENIERMTTDAALKVASFLYDRDSDILFLAGLEPSEDVFRRFQASRKGRVLQSGRWVLDAEGRAWAPEDPPAPPAEPAVSSNSENDDLDGFRARPPDGFTYNLLSLYDEITFLNLDGQEIIKVLAPDSPKIRHPLSPEKRNVAGRANTYVKAETYFEELKDLEPGQVYVSEVIGA